MDCKRNRATVTIVRERVETEMIKEKRNGGVKSKI